MRAAARSVGVSRGAAVYALAKIKDKVRTRSEFRGLPEYRPQRRQQPTTCWSLEQIRNARDCQLRGEFRTPVQLAKAMSTDDAIFTARRNRAAPQSSLATRLVPANGTRGKAVAKKAARSVHISRKALHTIATTLADHGVAIGYNAHEPSEDGTRVDFRLRSWPLEFVKWNNHARQLETTIEGGGTAVPILHGDGVWTVFSKYDEDPWAHDAAILPAAFVWGVHANGLTDWAAGSLSHGSAKVFGELPAGVALLGEDGALSAEAQAFLDMMQQIIAGGSPAGIRPAGAKTDVVANGSTAWQVFAELILSREKAAARIYLGTDAILGSVGGAPGVDIAELFAMATTIIQGDLGVIEAGLRTGVYEPWCAINEGDSTYAPSFRYNQPDPDASRVSDENAKRRERFHAEIERLKKNGFVIDQSVVNKVAADLGLEGPPALAEASKATTTLVLAPTDVARVVRVREARERAAGLPPFGDERDDMTITELEAAGQAAGQAAPPPTDTPPAAPLKRVKLEDRENDGKFAPKGSGDQTGAPGSEKKPKNDKKSAGEGEKAEEEPDDKPDEKPAEKKPPRAVEEVQQDLEKANTEAEDAWEAEAEAESEYGAAYEEHEGAMSDADDERDAAVSEAQDEYDSAIGDSEYERDEATAEAESKYDDGDADEAIKESETTRDEAVAEAKEEYDAEVGVAGEDLQDAKNEHEQVKKFAAEHPDQDHSEDLEWSAANVEKEQAAHDERVKEAKADFDGAKGAAEKEHQKRISEFEKNKAKLEAAKAKAEAKHQKNKAKLDAKLDAAKAKAEAKHAKAKEKADAKLAPFDAKLDEARAKNAAAQKRVSDLEDEERAAINNEVDADGDGRTGAEEEQDDDEQPSAREDK